MKYYFVILSLAAPYVASQCLVENPDTIAKIELKNAECSYNEVLKQVNKAKNVLRDAGVTTCLRKVEELGALLGLTDEGDMITKVESICDQAISRSRSDTDFTIDFKDVPLMEGQNTDTRIDRFLKEYYDGGTYYNEEVQQTHTSKSKNLNEDGKRIRSFYKNQSKNYLLKWPSSQVNNFNTCQFNSVMCCWVQDRQANDDNGNCDTKYPNGKLTSSELWTPDNCIDSDPADNTDICYVDMSRSPKSNHVVEGAIIYDDKDGVREGDSHCHGFAWANDRLSTSNRYRGNNLFYVSLYDHLKQRGYVRNVPGAPMCGCVEQMPTVSRADCTEMAVKETFELEYMPGSKTFHGKITTARVEYNACQGANDTNNDLKAYYERLVNEEAVANKLDEFNDYIVGEDNCAPAVASFLRGYGISRQ